MMNKRNKAFLCVSLLLALAPLVVVAQQPPELVVQTGHNDKIDALAFSPDGKHLASAGEDNTVRLWDVAVGRELRVLSGLGGQVGQVVFSLNGKLLAGSNSLSHEIMVWDVGTGKLLHTFKTGEQSIVSLSFSSQGRLLRAQTLEHERPGSRTRRRSWSLVSGKELGASPASVEPVNEFASLFSPDGRVEAYAASYDEDSPLLLRSASGGRVLHTLEGYYPVSRSIAFAPDGKILAAEQPHTGGNTIKVWSVLTGHVLHKYDLGPFTSVGSVAFSEDGKQLAAGVWDITYWNSKVLIWNLDSKAAPRQLAADSYEVNALAVSRDGKTIVSAGKNKRINFWDVATGVVRSSLRAHPVAVDSLSLSPDGNTLLSLGGGVVKLWDVASATEKPFPFTLPAAVAAATFSPNGEMVAVADVEYFNRRGEKVTSPLASREVYHVRVWEFPSGKPLVTIPVAAGRHAFSAVIAFSPDSKKIACSGYVVDNPEGEPPPPVDRVKPVIKVWDIGNLKEERTLDGHNGHVESLAFGPKGKILAGGIGGSEEVIKLWDLESPDAPRILPNAGNAKSLAFNESGSLLISGQLENNVKVWDVKAGSVSLTLPRQSAVEAVAFSADESVILSGGQDKRVTLWDAAAGKEVASLITMGGNDWQVEQRNDWLAVTPEGLFDGSPSAWKRILWRFSRNTTDVLPVESFYNEFYRPGLLAELLSGKHPMPQAGIDLNNFDRRQPRLTISLTDELGRPLKPEPGGAGVSQRSVRVGITITTVAEAGGTLPGGGAQDIRLFRNGSLVKIWRGDMLTGRSRVTLSTTVPIVAGANRFTAYAFNRDNVKSEDAESTVIGDPSLARRGVLYVLAVGVNIYENENYNLSFALADAEEFGHELKKQQMEQLPPGLRRYGQVEVVTLADRNATKVNILKALARLSGEDISPLPASHPLAGIRPTKPEDAVMVYFAGHGKAVGPDGGGADSEGQFYLIPHDMGYEGPRVKLAGEALNIVRQHSISDRELELAFEHVDASQLVLIVDACDSGEALESEEWRRGPMNSRGLAQLAYEKGMYILTASQGFQAAKESARLGHGLLTYALIVEGLRDGAADRLPEFGQIDLREWIDYAERRVPQLQSENEEGCRGLRSDIECQSTNKEELVKQLMLQQGRQRPRVFYRREEEPQPFVVAAGRVAGQ